MSFRNDINCGLVWFFCRRDACDTYRSHPGGPVPKSSRSLHNGLFRITCVLILLSAGPVHAQNKRWQQAAYIGYVYPAGGQQGNEFSVRIGGQRIDGASGAVVSGEGVHATVTKRFQKIGNQEMRLLREQLTLIKKSEGTLDEETAHIKKRLERRLSEYERKPANASIATVVLLNIQIDEDAVPGQRELRIITPRGLSNPLPFYVGRLPEFSRPAMKISKFQTLGKEHLALRKRPEEEVEQQITLPCTVNGQVASGEINRYRFSAHKGDRLVITALARQLVPYIADAVPGWFQPVLTLCNAEGEEVAFNDDYRFKPDPTLLYEAPETGDYVLSIHDSIYRGREDFVYRITLGETPFITSIFPPGTTAGEKIKPEVKGWNLEGIKLLLPDGNISAGIYPVVADPGDALSNIVPFAIDTLPERIEKNHALNGIQKVNLPVIITGRIEQPGEEDIYEFRGREGELLVAEIHARRLDSPLDSFIKLMDDEGRLIAFNDDHADPGSGLNTHHADSYLRVPLPASGTYRLHLTDTARHGGEAYIYRLRLSPPQPDFALRTVPSHVSLRRLSGNIDIYAIRLDGFDGPIRLTLNAPGFNAKPVTLPAGEEAVKMAVRCSREADRGTTPLTVIGTAEINGKEISHQAVPSEDWMQAFLWRHLVPAQELLAYFHEPVEQSLRPLPKEPDISGFTDNDKKMSKARRQITRRIQKICRLYQEGYLTDDLYTKTVSGLLDYKEPE